MNCWNILFNYNTLDHNNLLLKRRSVVPDKHIFLRFILQSVLELPFNLLQIHFSLVNIWLNYLVKFLCIEYFRKQTSKKFIRLKLNKKIRYPFSRFLYFYNSSFLIIPKLKATDNLPLCWKEFYPSCFENSYRN